MATRNPAKRYIRLLTSADVDTLERIIRELEQTVKVSRMDGTKFSDDVKVETRLWRESWIIEPLENNIKDLIQLLKTLKQVKREVE